MKNAVVLMGYLLTDVDRAAENIKLVCLTRRGLKMALDVVG